MPVRFRRVPDDNLDPTDRGTYRRVREYWDPYFEKKGRPNPYWAEIVCPGCGRGCMIGHNHVVKPGGVVEPSNVCPHEGCAHHEFIELDDWDRPATRSDQHEGPPAYTGDD